ncbi:CHAT domain-containing protein [Streptosporangium sp. NPDC005286]|uniref:CHAT domain-containing protein n=1 Tax=Streptosporangium sp. NPDC005286 TaxID=3154463 RepID=UPI0033B52FC9
MRLRWGGGPEERIERGVREYLSTGRTAEVSRPELTADAEQLLREVSAEPPRSAPRQRALQLIGWLYLCREERLVRHLDPPGLDETVMLVGLLHDVLPSTIPERLWELAVEFGADPDSRVQAARTVLDAARSGGADPLVGLVALERALSDLPADHAYLAGYHLLGATAWLERHEHFGHPVDLDNALARGRAALTLSTAVGSGRAPFLYVLCAILERRLAREDTAENARATVEMCRKLLAVAPAGSKEHIGAQLSLGEALSARFGHTRATADLDEAVHALRQGAEAALRAGAVSADQSKSLSRVLYRRYEQTHVREDLDEAIRVLEAAVGQTAWSDPTRASSMLTELRALERERAAGHGMPAAARPAPRTPHSRAEEACLLIARSEADADPLARDRGIELLGFALPELPEDFPDRGAYFAYLGSALLNRHRFGGQDPADLDVAEGMIRQAVRLCPEGNSNQVPFLTLLAMTADARYRRTGTREDLDAAVDTWSRLLALPLPVPRQRRQTLHSLGAHLVERFEHTGSLSDLDEAVDVMRQSLDVVGPPEEEYGRTALDLAATLILREEHTGAPHELDEARDRLLAALPYLPPGDTQRERANALLDTVTRRQEVHRTRHEEIVTPALRRAQFVSGPGDRPAVSPEEVGEDSDVVTAFQYGNVLAERIQRFNRTGDASELEAGLGIGRRVLAGMPANHPARTMISSHVGVLLLRRFEQYGDHQDLDTAVEHLRYGAYGPDHVVQQLRNLLNRPDADIEELRQATGGQVDALMYRNDRSSELSALAGAYVRRFERDGGSGDLDEAVDAARRAADTVPADDLVGRISLLQTLGTTLVLRYRHTRNRADLDQAIDLGRQVLNTSRTMGNARQTALSNLCNRLRTRYLLTGGLSDLEEAVGFGREAIEPTSNGHPDPADRINLALALWDRALLRADLADPTDLDAAIGQAEAAADALHASSPQRTHALFTLASMLRDRSETGGTASRPGDADRSLALFQEAARTFTSPPRERLDAAVAWGGFAAGRAAAGHLDWEAAAEGFATAVGLLPLAAWRGLERADRERLLAPRSNVATEAAACAISCGRLEQAVELLDQGRSVLWSQALDTRTDLTALREAHPETAERLEHLRAGLDGATGDPTGQQDVAERRRRLAREWEALLDEIRRRPGFEHFLLPLPFSALSEATTAGPMIIVNVSRYRCDALVVTPGRIRLIPLPDLTADEAQRRTERYLAALDRLNQPEALTGPSQQTVLATLEWLWDTVAGPVLDSHDAGAWQGQRVWWCPTGPLTLLPLHAAGYHDPDDGRERDAVMERVVSSYMPTLRGLIRAGRPVAPPDQMRRLLILALSDRPRYAPTLDPLPGAQREAESLRRRFPDRHTARLNADATCERALDLLASHTCVHFACHAGQNLADPSQGALYLYDKPLKVTDLARLDLETAELAVLSACQTAVGGTELPNEAIHLSAALLLGNFRHVVSTLWTVGDDSARSIIDEVYQELGDRQGRIHTSRTARALHDAVNRARRREPYRPIAWVSHVHFGL